MNETVEKIMNGKNVEIEEIFDLVNCYRITNLSLQDENNTTTLEMQVNHFESYKDVFEFSQEHTTDNSYVVKQSDIISIDTRLVEEIDCIIVKCQMPDNKKLNLIIYYVSRDFSLSELEEYREIDVYYLQEFLEDTLHKKNEYHCAMVTLADKFSVFLKMSFPKRVFIDTLDDEDWKLHISDMTTELNISVFDDGCNAFYQKDNGSSVQIVFLPYGQPFMEVKMLFLKNGK